MPDTLSGKQSKAQTVLTGTKAGAVQKGGSARINGMMPVGASGGELGAGRANGLMPSKNDGDVPDPGKYKGPKASTNQAFRPTKTGSAY